ncbi:MAG TPA: histidine ammonia-lyase [Steroidobacteraceae bacterium]
MSLEFEVDLPLTWQQIGAIGDQGASLSLSPAALGRIRAAHRLVQSLIENNVRAYGVNTGVGALCDVVVTPAKQRELSRNIIMSHAVGVGPALATSSVRAILAAAVNNYARGYSGVRPEVALRLCELLRRDLIPEVPSRGSVGYLTHMAHIALVLIGGGHARFGSGRAEGRRATDGRADGRRANGGQADGERMTGAAAFAAAGLEPLVLEAKEGLSLVNGIPCATGMAALALTRVARLLDWADLIGAMTFENLRGQLAAFDAESLSLRTSSSTRRVGERLRAFLGDSAILAASTGRRTQDPLSLRAIPQVHGAVRDQFAQAAVAVDTELASVSDNPVVLGTPDAPRAFSEAHAVGAAVGLAADALGIAVAELAAMAERRIDRLVNPLVSGLPAFLAADSGAGSGFMIAQYTAVSLAAENRRRAAPASLDGGITSGLQEDHLVHATPAALKLLGIVENAEAILAIELLAAAQAYDLAGEAPARARATDAAYRRVRRLVSFYRDDRPLAADIDSIRGLLHAEDAEIPC